MTEKDVIRPLISKIEQLQQTGTVEKAVLGFDGFMDRLLRPVKTQLGSGVNYFKTIADFADRIAQAAGKSGQIELVTQEIKLGGNAPIFSNSLGTLGVRNTCIGTMGYPDINPVFNVLPKTCEMITLANTGLTNAYEFDDGKLIFSNLSTFKTFDWEYIKNKLPLEKLSNIIEQSKLVGLVDWSNLIHCSKIWEGILEEIMPKLNDKHKYFFFDLADPSKKSIEEIKEILAVIGKYAQYGKVTLGANENETLKIYLALNNIPCTEKNLGIYQEKNLIEVGEFIFSKLSVDHLLIHPINRCICINKKESIELFGRVIKNPVISTGGGDNFNAGFSLGLINELSVRESMILAMATSGAYVWKGKSPDIKQLINYMEIMYD